MIYCESPVMLNTKCGIYTPKLKMDYDSIEIKNGVYTMYPRNYWRNYLNYRIEGVIEAGIRFAKTYKTANES